MILSLSLCVCVCVCLCPKSRPGGSVWTVMVLSVCVCPETRPGGVGVDSNVTVCLSVSQNSTGGSVWTVMLLSVCVCCVITTVLHYSCV